MGLGWRERLRIVAVTFVLTSAAWIAVGLVLYSRSMSPGTGGPDVTGGAVADERAMAPAGRAGPSGGVIVPVQGVRRDQLSDTWGDSREGGLRAHEGIDIMAPHGTPVVAAAPGTVERLFVSERGGNTIYVRSADRRTIHYYAHLDRYEPGLAEGQRVRAGQRIAFVGSSGAASPDGPHLHFAINLARPEEAWWQGTAINPYPLLRR